MTDNTNEDKKDSSTSEDHKDETKKDSSDSTSIDPVKEALDKENKGKTKFNATPAEKAAYALQENAKRLKALGGNPAEVLGIGDATDGDTDIDDVDEDDDKPMTRGDFKRAEARRTTQNALQLADAQIENENERELAKSYLNTRIKPSGDPQKDLEDAMALVNSVKNRQVATEQNRKSTTVVRRTSSGSGAPARHEEKFEASDEEITAARIAKVKPEDRQQWILNARNGTGVKFGTARAKKMAEEAKHHI